MQDDRTVIMPQGDIKMEFDTDRTVMVQAGLRVSLAGPRDKTTKEFFFTHGFSAGRSPDNDIVGRSR